MTQVLIIAEPTGATAAMVATLEENGCQVEARPTSTGVELAHPDQLIWDVLITDDINPPNPESVLARLPRVVISAAPTIREAVNAMRSGAADYLPGTVDGDELMASLERAVIEGARSHRRNEAPTEYRIIGDSAPIQELKSRLERFAATDTPVLIQGEPGTGKELTARCLHVASNRRARPLITVNCAAIPPQLLEQELFGRSAEGSEGAHAPGLLEAADGGTLFLDEVAELPPEVQARMLRLLQVGEIRPLGSSRAHAINVRLLVGSQRNLSKLVAQGDFREDLFFRLNVMLLQLPPLRDRGDDVLLISEQLLAQIAERLGRQVDTFSNEAREALVRYNWPGNVRELANAIERAVILAEAPVITPELLAIELTAPPPAIAADGQDQTTLEDYFVRFVLDNEEHCTETELAEKLGISRKSLWERRQRLNIPRRKTKKRAPRRSDSDSSSNS